MCGNSIGKIFKITTFGESHGNAVGVVIDGCPPGIPLADETIDTALEKRRPSNAVFSTSRREADRGRIISGIFNGRTTGAPLTVMIENADMSPKDYEKTSEYFRPGHADFTYHHKYRGFNDPRGGGRSSGRETVCRVAAGAVARELLMNTHNQPASIDLFAHSVQIGSVKTNVFEKSAVYSSVLKCADKTAEEKMIKLIEECKAAGDSIGGMAELIITGIPAGLGEPVFDKLDARLAYAIMGIPAVKGVEIGDGFAVSGKMGSENNDQMADKSFLSNHAGGTLGGISTGQQIVMRIAVKPTPSINKTQRTVAKSGENIEINISGRHDVCIVPRIIPVIEAMAWITLADFVLADRIHNNLL
ncbi:MAG: chorismate synthase [Deferribacteraceae bacterium]|jgi:chorismate synthase|nr:chorismate synthase [Deferribacteraceae bacterium]